MSNKKNKVNLLFALNVKDQLTNDTSEIKLISFSTVALHAKFSLQTQDRGPLTVSEAKVLSPIFEKTKQASYKIFRILERKGTIVPFLSRLCYSQLFIKE